MSRASLVAATTSDRYRRRFRRLLSVKVDAVTFDQAGGARLDVAYAVPFDSLGAAWIGEGMAYPLQLRPAVYGLDGAVVTSVDSTDRPVTWEADGVRWVAGRVSTAVPVGDRLSLRLLVAGEDSTGISSRSVPLRSSRPPPVASPWVS